MKHFPARPAAQDKRNFFAFLLVIVALLMLCICAQPVTVAADASNPSTQMVNLSMISGQSLKVDTPKSSNMTVMSIVGGQYDIQVTSVSNKNELQFTPSNASIYNMVIRISTNGTTYALISKQSGLYNLVVKNVSSTGAMILSITATVAGLPVTQDSNWNPVFGFTGFSLGGIAINTAEVIASMASFSIVLLGLGLLRMSLKSLYVGMFFLSLTGIIVVGVFVVGLAISVYLASFLLLRMLFGIKSRKGQGF